eukprot:3125041-Pyramimonas_sp.AAC.1
MPGNFLRSRENRSSFIEDVYGETPLSPDFLEMPKWSNVRPTLQTSSDPRCHKATMSRVQAE